MNKKLLSVLLLVVVMSHTFTNVYAQDDGSINNPKPSPTAKTSNEFIKINETVAIDSSINMTLYLDNISYDNFTFKLYSNNSLEAVNTNDIDIRNFNDEEISFDYCINCSSLKTITLNYQLPSTVEVGDNITFNIELINKDNPEEYLTYRKNVLVIESVVKEEKENPETEKNSHEKTSFPRMNSSSMNFGSSSKSTSISNISTKYKGSSNNYLSNITVKGYKLNKSFTKERLTYFVTVPNNVKSINISTSKENNKASVNISGNSNLSVGLNKVLITVTSEDGRVKNYRIYVTRMDSDSNEE